MAEYPKSLTTSEWVDYLVGRSKDEQIAALATWHRRIEYDAKIRVLNDLIDPDPDAEGEFDKLARQMRDGLSTPEDYR